MPNLPIKYKLQVLHFLLQNVRFCMDVQYIEKILPLVFLETVPNSPAYLAGLMNLTGKSIPVIDLAMRLGFTPNKPYRLTTPILLCTDGAQAGLIIDEVLGLADVEEEIMQMREEFNNASSLFIAAIALDTGVSLLINMERILDFRLSSKPGRRAV